MRQIDATQMTEAEYLAWSLTSEEKAEYVNGRLWAMSGGTFRHQAIATNVTVSLQVALRGKGGRCRALNSDQRVWIDETEGYLYPDVTVVCGPFEPAPQDRHSLVNPVMVVEVLSPSTRDHDLGAKWAHYRKIPSLQHYVLVDPPTRAVLHYARNAAGWQFSEHTEGSVGLAALGVELALDDVFADLENIPEDPP